MRIQINPHSLTNLEDICEVLYKLHPSVLNDLVEMERSFGNILGGIELNNLSLEQREFLVNINDRVDNSETIYEVDFTKEPKTKEEYDKLLEEKILLNNSDLIDFLNKYNEKYYSSLIDVIQKMKKKDNSCQFFNLKKYLKLDTDEYIPMKIYVEVEDPVIGRKVKELVEALEKTRAPEQFYFHKREVDEDAYFAEGYGLTTNNEQEKQKDDFLDGEDVEGLEKLLRKEKLYP